MSTNSRLNVASGKGRSVTLWGAQLLLAATFGLAGAMKLTQPILTLTPTMAWAADVPPALVRFVGTCEALAAVGLIVPVAAGVKPWLTPVAAAGLLAVMILAVPFHISRGELALVPVNVILGAIAAFVAWGRSKKAPLLAR